MLKHCLGRKYSYIIHLHHAFRRREELVASESMALTFFLIHNLSSETEICVALSLSFTRLEHRSYTFALSSEFQGLEMLIPILDAELLRPNIWRSL